MNEIVVRYLPEHNPSGAWYPGVPLRDLTQQEWDNIPGWLKASCISSGMYELLDLPQAGDAAGQGGGQPDSGSSGKKKRAG